MLELLQITADPEFARRCDDLGGFRLFVDLERMGKAERQAGRNTFISAHQLADVGRVKRVLRHARLMVRVNPLHDETPREVQQVLDEGADCLMLPMFTRPQELRDFAGVVAGRVPVIALLETAGALATVGEWAATPGLEEVFVGLNDLHISLRQRFMFEPLADGSVERVAQAAHAAGRRFGFGGLARLDGGLLPGRAVLGEHLRLGSQAVILSRTFHAAGAESTFEELVAQLRAAEAELAARTPAQVREDAAHTAAEIGRIAAQLGAAA